MAPPCLPALLLVNVQWVAFKGELCLWQANTSTIDTMSYFLNFNTCIREMNFCQYFAISVLMMGMTATLKKPEILHIEKRTHHCKIGLATSIYRRAASELCGYFDASKWQTRDYIVQLKSSEFRDAGKICPCSTCIQGLFANHWVLAPHSSWHRNCGEKKPPIII